MTSKNNTVHATEINSSAQESTSPLVKLLNGATLAIFGATGSLGSELAQLAGKHGAKLILSGRDSDKLAALADDLAIDDVALWPLDLAKASATEIHDGALQIGDTFPCIDYVIHCSAMLGQQSPLMQYDPAIWHQVMQVNVNSPLFINQAIFPLLEASTKGFVIFVGDKKTTSSPYWGAYGASKALIINLANSLHVELAANGHSQALLFEPKPFTSKLRANAYPGSNPELECSPAAEALRLLESLLT